MSRPRKKTTRQLVRAALELADSVDHLTAFELHTLIEAMDAIEGDPDFEPSLGSLNIHGYSQYTGLPTGRAYDPFFLHGQSMSQERWAVGGVHDIEHDPADLGEPEDKHV